MARKRLSDKQIDRPKYCDYGCEEADFPPAGVEGLCRTMAGVWCRRLKRLVSKNALCEVRREQEAAAGRKAARKTSRR